MPRRTLQRRCDGCGLIPGRCLCDKVGRVRLPWRLLIVQHVKEAAKPTNTARLLARVVEECTIVPLGGAERPWTADRLGPHGEQRLLLFPSPTARVLDAQSLVSLASSGSPAAPTCFVLLDATWRLAARMARHAEGIAELPRVQLPPGAPSRWNTRKAPRPDQLCTFETVVRLAALAPQRCDVRALATAFELLLAAQSDSTDPVAAR